MGILDTFYILFETDAKKAEREMAEVRKEGARTAGELDKSVRKAKDLAPALSRADQEAGRLGRSAKQVAGLMTAAAAAAGALAVGALMKGANTYTEFTNSLRVAGLEGSNLAEVQERLYRSSVRNGASLTALGQLYGRVTSASSELGVSQAEILQVTDAVSAAIRVQGGDAASASGAMLQLAQALGSGTVRAEEFNSINEGMLPLLQAAANASEKYGGSVAKLRQAVMDGAVTSQEFFQLIKDGTRELEGRAGMAVATDAQRREKWNAVVARQAGKLDALIGFTRTWNAVNDFAIENLDFLAVALGATAVIAATIFAPAMWAAAAPVIAMVAPFVLIGAAIAAVGVAFALAYDDIKAFTNGQKSLLGDLMERYPAFRKVINGLVTAFRAMAPVVMSALRAILGAGVRTFNGLAGFVRGFYSVAAPIFSLFRDVVVAVWGAISRAVVSRIRPWLPLIRLVFAAMTAGVRVVGQVFEAIFGAIGRAWDRVFGAIVRGLNTVINGFRTITGLGGVSDNARAAARGQQQFAAAGRSPMAAATPFSVTNGGARRGGDRNVSIGEVNVNTAATDANAISRDINGALGAQFRDAGAFFDDGVER